MNFTVTKTGRNNFKVAELDNRTRGGYATLKALRRVFGEGRFGGAINGKSVTVDTYKLVWEYN